MSERGWGGGITPAPHVLERPTVIEPDPLGARVAAVILSFLEVPIIGDETLEEWKRQRAASGAQILMSEFRITERR